MKNCWLERHKAKNKYLKYTVYLYTLTSQGQEYFAPQPLAAEVAWDINGDTNVYGFAFFLTDKPSVDPLYIHRLQFPIRVQIGDTVVGKFDTLMFP